MRHGEPSQVDRKSVALKIGTTPYGSIAGGLRLDKRLPRTGIQELPTTQHRMTWPTVDIAARGWETPNPINDP